MKRTFHQLSTLLCEWQNSRRMKRESRGITQALEEAERRVQLLDDGLHLFIALDGIPVMRAPQDESEIINILRDVRFLVFSHLERKINISTTHPHHP